jgi:hypothetical protein
MSLEKTTGGQEAPLTQANDPRTPLQDQLQKATEIAINQKAQELPGELSKKHVNTGEINILSPEAEVHETLESERKLKGLLASSDTLILTDADVESFKNRSVC